MAGDAMNVGKGKMTLADFKAKHVAHLDLLIDPDQPDLGPKNKSILNACKVKWNTVEKKFAKRWTQRTHTVATTSWSILLFVNNLTISHISK